MNIVNPTGQTALGPALFVAAGVASNYGPGSLIVLVTDGEGNRGILSEDQSYME
jgi:Mg-chelatase subunit ChlD